MSSLASLEFRKDNERCISLLEQALAIAKTNNIESRMPFIPYELARAYVKFHNDLERAISYTQESVRIQTELGLGWNRNPEPWYYAHSLLADYLLAADRFEEAIAAYRVCIEVDSAINTEMRLAESLFRLGKALCISGSYVDSIKEFAKSLHLLDKHRGNPEIGLDNMKWMAIATWYRGKYKEALYFHILHVNQCALYDVAPNILQIVRERDLVSRPKISDVLRAKEPLLVLPAMYDFKDLRRWARQIERKHPELGALEMFTAIPKQDI